jgi:hypothetical protein
MTNDERMTKLESPRSYEDSFWLDGEATRVREEPKTKPTHDLEERTARFGEGIIDFAKVVPQGPTTNRIISQLVGAGTSVGANYVEADDSVSKKEFLKCIGNMQERSPRDEALSADGSPRRPGAKTRSKKALDGSEGTAPDLLQDLENRQE